MKIWFLLFALGINLSGCHADPPVAAPLGERAALEKLAGAYETLSEQLPVAAAGLPPEGKLKFVKKVFAQAGYDYGATLQALAQTPPQSLSTYHIDMMELVLLPDQGLSEPAAEQLYDAGELANIKTIKTFAPQ